MMPLRRCVDVRTDVVVSRRFSPPPCPIVFSLHGKIF
jgi:hypothetical protein